MLLLLLLPLFTGIIAAENDVCTADAPPPSSPATAQSSGVNDAGNDLIAALMSR
jgi:hypothetical protein